MTTRILAPLCGFALCVLLACGDPASAQPPNGHVTWGTGPPAFPQPYDPVGPPMPQKGGVSVYGTYAPPMGWQVGPIECSIAPKTGGVTLKSTIDRTQGAFGYYDAGTNSVVPAKVILDPGEYNVWVTITYTRMDPIKGTPESLPVSTAIVGVKVK